MTFFSTIPDFSGPVRTVLQDETEKDYIQPVEQGAGRILRMKDKQLDMSCDSD